jgi:hypothetical protein
MADGRHILGNDHILDDKARVEKCFEQSRHGLPVARSLLMI